MPTEPNGRTKQCFNPANVQPPSGFPASSYYSWAVKKGPFVFLAGMVPTDKDKEVIGTDLSTQARQTFENLKASINAAGGSLEDVCATTVFVTATDLQRDVYPDLNPVYHEYFPEDPPARTTIGKLAMPYPNMLIQVNAIAVLA